LSEIIASDKLSQARVTMDIATTVDEIDALRPSYQRLHAASGNRVPFAMHEWHVAWVRHFLNSNPRILDQPFFNVARNSNGECVGIIPFIISRRNVGPLKVTAVNLLGADPNLTEIRAPMIMPGYEHIVAFAAQQQLRKTGAWDWVHWTGLSAAFSEALAANCALKWQEPQTDFVLDLAPTWEQFRSGLKRNISESLRHCYNSLKRDNHKFEFRVVESPTEAGPALDRFFELHTMRANVTGGARHPDRFALPLLRNFLHEACRRFAKTGALRIFQLKIDNEIVATRVGFLSGDSLYLYNSGFDPRWARYSVMTTTVAEAIKYAIGHGIKTVNLSPDREVSKTRWGPREVEYKSAYQQCGRLRSRMAQQAYIRARSGGGLQGWVLQHLVPARRNWR
jgi:CelD/BcsL family acetyltransferase involved in cellulose biosynthesis